MHRVAAGIYVKERITLHDVVSVVRYSEQAEKEPTRRGRLRFMKLIVKQLTSRRWFVNLRDLYYLPQILEACRLSRQGDADIPEEIENSILKTASSIGAKCNKLPYEILTGMTLEETEIYSLHLLLERYEKALSMVYAQHIPEEYSKETHKKLQETQGRILNFGKVFVAASEALPAPQPREIFAMMGNVG